MKARDYAISLGLAKPGRGKLSFAAHDAIKAAIAAGQVFEDYADGKVLKPNVSANRRGRKRGVSRVLPGNDSGPVSGTPSEQAQTAPEIKIPESVIQHDYSTIYGIDTRGRSPIVIAFQYCSKCIKQVVYCSHAIPQLPTWIGGGDGLITKPTEEEAWHMYTILMEDTGNTKPWSETKS